MQNIRNGEPVVFTHECPSERKGRTMSHDEYESFIDDMVYQCFSFADIKLERLPQEEKPKRFFDKMFFKRKITPIFRNSNFMSHQEICDYIVAKSDSELEKLLSFNSAEFEEKYTLKDRCFLKALTVKVNNVDHPNELINGDRYIIEIYSWNMYPKQDNYPINSPLSQNDLVRKVGEAWVNLDADALRSYLDKDFHYTSDFIFSEISSRDEYLYYLRGKFSAIRKTNNNERKVRNSIVGDIDKNNYDGLFLKLGYMDSVAYIEVVSKDGRIVKMAMHQSLVDPFSQKDSEDSHIEDTSQTEDGKEYFDFEQMHNQTLVHLESAFKNQAIKFRRATEKDRISLGEVVSGMFTDIKRSDVQSMAIMYRLSLLKNSEENQTILNDVDEIWNYDLFSCILKNKTEDGHYTQGLYHETTLVIRCVKKTVILALTSLGGVDTLKYMRVSLISPCSNEMDDGLSFMTAEETKTQNMPVFFSFILSYSEVEDNKELDYYEKVERSYNEKNDSHKELDEVEKEYDHGKYESRPQYYPGYGEWLFAQQRYYDAYFTLERTFKFAKSRFDELSEEWKSAYYMACNKMGQCLSIFNRNDEATYYFRQGAPDITIEMPNYLALSTARIGDPLALWQMDNWLKLVSQKCGNKENWNEDIKQFSVDVPKILFNYKKKMDQHFASHPNYNDIITIGYVLDRLFGVKQNNLAACMFIFDLASNLFLPRVDDLDKISKYRLNSDEAKNKVFVLSCTYAHYLSKEEVDKSILCVNAPIIISTHPVQVEKSNSVMRVDIVRCNFQNDDDKQEFVSINKPLTKTFCLGLSSNTIYSYNRDSLLEAVRKAIELRYERRFVECLKLAKWVFDCSLNMVKDNNGYSYESQDELLKDIFLESAFSVGYCLVELGNTAAASYYLELARHSMRYEYVQEYVNFLSITKDSQALEMVEEVMEQSPKPETEDGIDQWNYHMAFLKRRKAYILIDKKKFDEAERLLKEMKDDPLCKEFAEGELKYIEQLRNQ